MFGRWKLFGFHLHNVLCIILTLHLQSDGCLSLNFEGLALMEFRMKVEYDPHGVFDNWNPEDDDPCSWWGVHCDHGKVELLNLSGQSLRGPLASELGKLSNLRALVLCNNNFSGSIPKEFGRLTKLELLDLRSNNLSGAIPFEIGEMLSLKHLRFCDNKFNGDIPSRFLKFNMLSTSQFEADPFLSKVKSAKGFSRNHGEKHGDKLKSFSEPYLVENEELLVNSARRKLLQATNNLPAVPVRNDPIPNFLDVPSTGSGSFSATSNPSDKRSPSSDPTGPTDPMSHDSPATHLPFLEPAASSKEKVTSDKGLGIWAYLLMALAGLLFLVLVAAMLLMGRSNGVATIGPWKTGLSGQLQKALIAGIPKLNRTELEASCEDFSNIIQSYPEFTVYKGTLSSGVEIAVASTVISSFKDWSERSETHFRRKIDILSRVNHKNFVNLLGYCEEDEPFMRMMVFEYAPSGTLYEHLHVKELEHLDWSARMRIIMGIAYCLQYMHHELNPPVAHTNVQSSSVLLTDDYAAKIIEMEFWKEIARGKISGDDMSDISDISEVPLANPPSNVFSFGILLLEVISGKPPFSKEHGSILNWASEHLKEKPNISNLVDPTLKSVKNNELDTIYEVIQECVHQEPRKRPTMKEVTCRLREVLGISPESATPRLSPLWWAELEILSVEAS